MGSFIRDWCMKANRIVWINRFDDDGVPPVGRVSVQVELGEKSGANLEIQPIKFLWKNNGNVGTWSGELHCLELYENEAEKKLARIWDLRDKHQNENDSLLIPLCTGRKGRNCASRRKNGGATIEHFNFREDRSTGSALALKIVMAARQFIERKDKRARIANRRLDDVDDVSPRFGAECRKLYRLYGDEWLAAVYALFTAKKIILVKDNKAKMTEKEGAFVLRTKKRFCTIGYARGAGLGVTHLKQTGIGGLRNGFLWKKDCDICVFESDKEGGDSSALIPFRIECLEWMYFEFKGVEGYSLICVDYGGSQVCAMINDWYDIRFLSVFEEPLRAGRPVGTGELSSYDLGHAIKGVLSVLDPIEGGAKEEVEDVEVEVEVKEVTINIKTNSKRSLMGDDKKEGDAKRIIRSFDK